MSRTKVTNLMRVQQGNKTVEMGLSGGKLEVAIIQQGKEVSVTLHEAAVEVLREMLGLQKAKVAILATELPPGSHREGDKPPADGQLTERQLAEGGDHAIEGMG